MLVSSSCCEGCSLSMNMYFLLLFELRGYALIDIIWLLSMFLQDINYGLWSDSARYPTDCIIPLFLFWSFEMYFECRLVLIPLFDSAMGCIEYIFKISSFEVSLLCWISLILIEECKGNWGVKGLGIFSLKNIYRLLKHAGVDGFSWLIFCG